MKNGSTPKVNYNMVGWFGISAIIMLGSCNLHQSLLLVLIPMLFFVAFDPFSNWP